MTNKFSCFLTPKGRWLTATLFLLFSLGIGNAWGTCDPGTIFKVVGKDGLTNANIAKGDAIDLSSYVTVNAGTITAYGKNDGSLAVIDQKAINIVKYADAYFTCTLPTGCSLQEGDVIKYIIYNKNAYLQPATDSDDEDKLTLTKTSNITTEGKVVIPAGHELIGKSTFYLYGSANATKVRSLEIIRPYTITLDATTNGGTAVSPVKGLSGDKVVLTHAFKKDNEPLKYYKFKGWYENESGGDPVSNLYTVTGDKTLYAQFEDLPTGGTMFSLQMESSLRPASAVGLASGKTLDLLTYATISGGAAILENTTSSNDKGKITTSGEISFNDNGALVTITLDFPLQAGDEIEHVGNNYQLCYTKTKTYATTFSSTAKKYTVTDAADGLKGATTLYVWRAASSETKVTKITITRPTPHTLSYAVSPAGKGTVTLGATSLIEGATTTATYSAIDAAYEFDEWQISGTGATLSSASTNPTTVTMGSADATVTLKLKAAVTKYTITYSKGANGTGTAIPDGKKDEGVDFTLSDATYSRDGYVQTGWATEDGGAKVYELGGTYSTDADEELFPFWTPVYTVTKGTHANGDFTISPASQVAGGTVTLDPTPADGYMFSAWEIVKTSDASATGITVTNKQFEMPAYGVTVNATFVTDTRKKVLYLTTTNEANTKANDKLYAALKDDYKVTIAAPDAQTLTNYDLVVLHESINGKAAAPDDADNRKQAVLDAKTTSVPVLNTKTYFYNSGRWGWGTPNNGKADQRVATLNSGYCNITDHPIFNDVTISAGAVTVLANEATGNTMQPVVPSSGKEGYLLATTPNKEGGESSYAIQEIPAGGFRGASSGKYILISVSNAGLNNLTADGQKLFQNAAAYLTSATTWTPVEGLTNAAIDATGNPFSEGATMTLTASATGATAATTYAWYKGATWSEAETAGAIQAAETAENSGHIYTKTAAPEDAGKYWCVMVKSTGCEVTASVEVSVLTCTKPGTPANLAASNEAFTTADLSWDAADNADGYKISIIKKEGGDVIQDWTDNATTSYAATGLTQGTEYTFKVKAKGASGYCEFGLEATEDFTTTAPSVADLVTIDADYTFTPSVNISAGTLSADSKFFAAGTGDCDMNDGKMRVKENRALAFKVADKAKIKVTFATKSGRQIQLGTALSEGNYDTYGYSESSPYTFDVVTTGGVVYLTAHDDQLYFSKLEIIYPRTVTYDLNGGTGTQPTESAHYEGDKFTVHNGVTGITAPSGQEFDKWKDQDNADVAGGAEYTMPAKAVTLTAQWRAETVKYTVTYDLDDYTAGVAPTETDKAAGDVFAIKAAPSRDGYAFMGWLCNIDAQTYQATDDYTMTAAATTFTAVWKQEFQVTYNRQGHGGSIAPQIIVDGGKVTKPADPEEMLYEFGGWYKEAACTNAWDFDNDVVTTNTELFAKWTEFDGCAYLAPVASGDALVVGDNVNLKTGSFGGTVKVAGLSGAGKIAYNAAGLAFTGGQADSIRVTLENKMMAGTKITVRLQANNTGDRGLKLRKLDKTEVASLGWSSATVGAVESFTYTVVANDGLDGKKAFILSRNNTVYLKYISVENCAPQDFAVTYKDGETTLGTEDVFEGYHPTAAGIATKKLGYSFLGWSETDGGALVDLDDITITAAKDLYAKYEAIDCPTSGTVYKFVVKDELASETLPAITDKDMSSYVTTTGHGYLTYTATSNGKAVVNNDGTIQMKDATAAYLKVELDCALGAGDQIRAHISSNPMRVQVGTTYDSNKDIILAKDNYVFVDITSDMVGKQVLYITRSTNGNANIADFEIYRRPVLTDVSLSDMTMRTSQALAPQMTLTPAEGLVTSQAWEITAREGAADAEINATTGVITTGTETGTLTVQATINGTFVRTCTVTVINIYTSLVPVTESTTWNWAGAASIETKINDVANRGVILGNYINGANFEKLDGIAGEYEYAYRNNSYPGFQGTQLHFVTTVPGMLTITARNSGAGQRVYVNNHEVTTSDLTSTPEDYMIAVPAGDVTITSSTGQNMRIYAMKFDTNLAAYELTDNVLNGYTRTVPAGQYGTICLATDGVMTGGILFEIAYYDSETRKIFFDEVLNGEMIADRPYVFLPEENSTQLKVFYTEEENAEVTAGHYNGLWGTYVDLNSSNTTESPLWHNYIISNNMYIRVTGSNCTLRKNRAYIKFGAGEVPESPTAPLPGRRRISLGTNSTEVATDIDNVQGDNVQCTKVMIDGQLYILRGEKLYDATGRLVK